MYLQNDIIENFINRWLLRDYEKSKEKQRKAKKVRINNNSRIIVKLDNDIIFDSKDSKTIDKELLCSLKTYEFSMDDDVVRYLQNHSNKKRIMTYNITPSITSIFPSENLEAACLNVSKIFRTANA